jgi:hypothetical protein
VLVQLGAAAHELRGVEVVSPSLESVFLALTGRRYASEASPTEPAESDENGMVDVVAS